MCWSATLKWARAFASTGSPCAFDGVPPVSSIGKKHVVHLILMRSDHLCRAVKTYPDVRSDAVSGRSVGSRNFALDGHFLTEVGPEIELGTYLSNLTFFSLSTISIASTCKRSQISINSTTSTRRSPLSNLETNDWCSPSSSAKSVCVRPALFRASISISTRAFCRA